MPLDAGVLLEIATTCAASDDPVEARVPGRYGIRKTSRKILRIVWYAAVVALVSPVIFARGSPAPRSLLSPRWLQD